MWLYVVFHDLSDYTSNFPTKQPEISSFLTIIEFDRQMKKNVLVGAHKKFERVQHTEIHS